VSTDALQGAYDTVLLSVKAQAVPQAIEDLAPAVGPRTRLVPFLNGMAHIDQLNDHFGTATVLGGVVKVATQLDADGDIVQVAPGASMTVGAQDGVISPRLEEVTVELADAGFDFSLSDQIITAMWAKWAFISTISSVTCLMRGTIGDVVACPGGADLGPAVLAEAATVAAASGHAIHEDEIAATTLAATAAGSTLTSSMYRDLQEGHAVEVEQVLGDLIRRGRLASRPTPRLDVATLNLRVYERRRSSNTL
jgi:2-dehydropantoate 2-reductase